MSVGRNSRCGHVRSYVGECVLWGRGAGRQVVGQPRIAGVNIPLPVNKSGALQHGRSDDDDDVDQE